MGLARREVRVRARKADGAERLRLGFNPGTVAITTTRLSNTSHLRGL
jgi:hypothetical protein